MSKKSKKSKKSAAPAKVLGKGEVLDAIVQALTAEDGEFVSKKQAKAVVEYLPQLIAEQVASAGKFNLHGIGIFNKKIRPAVKAKEKKVRNPSNGEMVWQKPRPASILVKMRPSKAFKDAVNEL